jgi:hypothetical protein
MNPHAQSKACPERSRRGSLPRHSCLSRPREFSLFREDREGHEFHSCHISAQPGTRLQPLTCMFFLSFFLLILCKVPRMSSKWSAAIFATILVWPTLGHAENLVKEVKKAVENSTLDQAGTKPFHLKATLAPSFDRDKAAGLAGEVEIWWASPTKWKREVRSPEFHGIEIVDGARDWQKNEGDYFPEWLRETAVELIKPVPPLEEVLERVKTAEVRHLMGQTNVDWTTVTGTAEVRNILRSYVALRDSTGMLLYAGGFGWGGEFKDYASFHGRMIARTVNVGSPQVTAKVTMLEDLADPTVGLFDTEAKGGDPHPLRTVLLDEPSLRKNLLPMQPVSWPPLKDGTLEGNVTTLIVVDREGMVREIKTVISENSGVNETGKQAITAMRFKPFVVDGVPVQVMSQFTLPFKTTRPAPENKRGGKRRPAKN